MANDYWLSTFTFESDLSQDAMNLARLNFIKEKDIKPDSDKWICDFYYHFNRNPDGSFNMYYPEDDFQCSTHPYYDELIKFIMKVIKVNTFVLIENEGYNDQQKGIIVTSNGKYPVGYEPHIDGKSPQEWFDSGGEVTHALRNSRKGG